MDHACSCKRTKKRSTQEEKALLNRLNRISGQIRGIYKMVEEDAYCTDILTQAAAAREALGSFSRMLLEEHIRTCVCQDLKEGKDGTAEDLVRTLRRLMK
ncbi:MAG: metal-sensing transcriptional repressor [Clostridia bacterium]|nr:metal-sensing transcriptional repressor [Clostridia bacterium]